MTEGEKKSKGGKKAIPASPGFDESAKLNSTWENDPSLGFPKDQKLQF